MNFRKNILKWLPYIYFSVLFILITGWSVTYQSLILIVLSVLFMLQLIFQVKYADWISGLLMLLLSLWLLLAYASDFHKITSYTQQTWKFVVIGGLFVVSNFIMSILLIRNAINRADREETNVEKI